MDRRTIKIRELESVNERLRRDAVVLASALHQAPICLDYRAGRLALRVLGFVGGKKPEQLRLARVA